MRVILLLFLVLMISIALSCKSGDKQTIASQDIPAKAEAKKAVVKKTIIPRFEPPKGWTEIEAKHIGFHLDLRYATENNFVEEQMYQCGKCFLQTKVAKQLWKAKNELQKSGYQIVLYDCYRPRPIQQKLWDKVPDARYVTPPKRGSMHNRGAAIDLGLTDLDGNILDMGTEFDYFGEEAYQTYTKHPKEIMDRRYLLKNTMEQFGFRSIRTEWWHYSLDDASFKLSEWVWECE